MISKISIPFLLIGGTMLSVQAQHLFIHGDHVDEGYLLGEKSQVVNIPTQQLSQFKCQFIDENYAINLQQLSIDAPNGVNDYVFTNPIADVEFHVSFCETLSDSQCSVSTMATENKVSDNSCLAYLSGGSPVKDAEITYTPANTTFNPNDNGSVSITYTGGESDCVDPRTGAISNYGLLVIIYCNPEAPSSFYNPDILDLTNPCLPVVGFESPVGCAVEVSYIWSWITDNQWVMFSLAVAIGFFICFFGLKLYKPIFFISGTLITIFIIVLIFYSTFLKSTTESWVPWVVIAGALLVGLLVGFIVMKISILGAFILAFIGGYCGALLIWNTFLYLTTTSNALFYSFTIGIGFICGVLSLIFFEHVVILASALGGSFMVIAGIGIVAGGYQNPFTIEKTLNGEPIQPTFYAYMAGNLVLFIIGALVQYHMRNKDSAYKHPYHNLR